MFDHAAHGMDPKIGFVLLAYGLEQSNSSILGSDPIIRRRNRIGLRQVEPKWSESSDTCTDQLVGQGEVHKSVPCTGYGSFKDRERVSLEAEDDK